MINVHCTCTIVHVHFVHVGELAQNDPHVLLVLFSIQESFMLS